MADEIWKEIPDYPNYTISNYGRLKNIKFDKMKAPCNDKDGYKITLLYNEGKRKNIRFHQLVANAFIPNPNNLPEIDHIDNDKSNNRADNLRWATRSTNSQNRNGVGKSKYKGVSIYNVDNRTYIRAACKKKHLGYFETEEDAARAYDAKARELYGENARTNF